jgi:hypothetical protein
VVKYDTLDEIPHFQFEIEIDNVLATLQKLAPGILEYGEVV